MTEWPGQERLAALVELGVDAVMLVDEYGVIRWVNASFREVLGHSPSDLINTPARDMTAPEDDEAWRRFLADLIATPGACRSAAFRMRHQDGPWRRPVVTARNLLLEPEIGAIVLQFRADTPEHAWTGIAATDRYRHFFEDATDIIFEADCDGHFTLVNPAAVGVFGYDYSEIIGRRFTEFVRADYREIVLEHYRRQLNAGERSSYIEFPAMTKDKREIWLGQSAWLAVDASGQCSGVRAVARDIGERRRAEAALLQAQKMEAVGRLAGGIAHDFNNLLTAIRGNAELLLHHVRRDPARVADVEEILHAADRAATMTRQLLAFSRKHTLAPVKLNVNELAENVARLSRRLIGPEIALEIQARGDLQPVMADASQLEQLLLNLVLNARDAMPDGGRIVVRTGNRRLPDGSPESAKAGLSEGDYVLLQVIDNGIGMDQATQARIFEPFFTTKEPGRGTGLGLSTVYGIVRQMGGGVTVLSERNQGATFSVFLPVSAESQEMKHA